MNLTITGYSTALFSTWFFIDELGLLFDAGDGLSSGLLQKSRKVKHVFVSHADRDHLAGLLQFNQLNARDGSFPIIYYPADSGSFPALENFSKKFDPHISTTLWKPIRENQAFPIKTNLSVETMRSNHKEIDEEITKCLSFKLIESKRKLKKDFVGLEGIAIKKLTEEKGRDFITNKIEQTILGYSGDTPVDDYEKWDGTKVLIHEATFIGEKDKLNTRGHHHSTLAEVMEMAANIKIEKLILSHFSSRYSQEQIDEEIKKECKRFGIKIPIYRILPGEISRNILGSVPLNI